MATSGQRNGASNAEEVAHAVRAIVAEKLQRPAGEAPWDADLESELGIDSLVMIEINVLLEEHFHFAPAPPPSYLTHQVAIEALRANGLRRG